MARAERRRTPRALVASLLVVGSLLASIPAHGRSIPISLGEVTTRVTRTHVDVPQAFRSEVERQLAQVDVRDIRDEERVVLSASLLKLETETQGDRAHSTCVVSATLRRAKGGALVAVLRGKARAEDARSAASSNELAVLRAAVHSAMRGVPQALH